MSGRSDDTRGLAIGAAIAICRENRGSATRHERCDRHSHATPAGLGGRGIEKSRRRGGATITLSSWGRDHCIMQSIRKTGYLVGLTVAAVAFAAGCTGGERNPSPSSASVQKGQLGNGGFTFRCDDSVACDRWNNAGTFPEAVALGSTFDLQFYLLDGTRGFSYLKEAEAGTTTEAVGKYINRGASGFAAVEPGIATLAARDSKGWLVDYITVRIRKP